MGNLVRKCCSNSCMCPGIASDVPKTGMPSVKRFLSIETRNLSANTSDEIHGLYSGITVMGIRGRKIVGCKTITTFSIIDLRSIIFSPYFALKRAGKVQESV